MPTSEEVKAYFDTVSRQWDTMRQAYYGVKVIDKSLIAAGLAQRGTKEDHPMHTANLLVDVGCGTGFLTAGIAPFAQKVIGVDDSTGMLEVAQNNLNALSLTNVELRQGNVSNLPVENSAADAVFANMVLHHAPDPQVMVQEMARVTRPRGKVVITDADSHDKDWFRAEMADVWLGFTKQQIRQFMKGAGLTNFKFGWVGTQ